MTKTTTLTEVNQTLKEQNKTVKDTNDSIKSLVGKISAQMEADEKYRLRDLNKKKASPKAQDKSGAFAAGEKTADFLMGMPAFLLNPTKLIAPMLAALTAVGGVFLGFRGWEKAGLGKALKSIKSNISVPKRVAEAMLDLKKSTLAMFGIGADGKKIPIRGIDGKFKNPNWIQKAVRSLLKPLGWISNAAQGVGKFLGGAGSKMFSFLKPFLAGASGFAKLVGKLLWPLGVFMSMFDGVSAFMNTEGSIYEKFAAGISATIGDFIGAPLDLLKNMAAWVLSKFGFDETADTIKSFSIETLLKDTLNGILLLPKKAFDWIKSLFTDPTETLGNLWSSVVGLGSSIIDILWFPVNTAIDWVTKKFGWRDEDAPKFNLKEWLTEKIMNIIDTVKSYIPTAESIKRGVYNGIAALPGGQSILDFLGIEVPATRSLPPSFGLPEFVPEPLSTNTPVGLSAEDAAMSMPTQAGNYTPAMLAQAQKAGPTETLQSLRDEGAKTRLEVPKGMMLTDMTSTLMKQDQAESMKEIAAWLASMSDAGSGGTNVSMDDNSTKITNTSGIVMNRGPVMDLLDGGLALGAGPR